MPARVRSASPRRGATYLLSWSLVRSQPPLAAAERSMVLESLRQADGKKVELIAALALEDKVYAVVTTAPSTALGRAVAGWKRSASRVLTRSGRADPVWRRGYSDRILRDAGEVDHRIRQLRAAAGGRGTGAEETPGLWVRAPAATPPPSAASAPPVSP